MSEINIGKQALKVLVKSIDLKGLANGLIDDVLEVALDKVVEATSTPFDDAAKAALWPILEGEVKKLIEEHLDLEKLLKVEEKSDSE